MDPMLSFGDEIVVKLQIYYSVKIAGAIEYSLLHT